MHYIEKIDKNIYNQVTNKKILTDDIITDNRIQHIIERRGQEFYDKYNRYFEEIVANPDYVFKDKNEALYQNYEKEATLSRLKNSVWNFLPQLLTKSREKRHKKTSVL